MNMWEKVKKFLAFWFSLLLILAFVSCAQIEEKEIVKEAPVEPEPVLCMVVPEMEAAPPPSASPLDEAIKKTDKLLKKMQSEEYLTRNLAAVELQNHLRESGELRKELVSYLDKYSKCTHDPEIAHVIEKMLDKYLRPWKLVKPMKTYEMTVFNDMELSFDGKLVAQFKYGNLTVRDLSSDRKLYSIEDIHSYSAKFSHDSKKLALTSFNKLYIVTLGEDKAETREIADKNFCWAMEFSEDDRFLAIADRNIIEVFSVETGETVHKLQGHTEGVVEFAFSPDGKFLASASHDKTVRVWDMETGNSLHILKGHSEAAWAVTFNNDGSLLATAGGDSQIKIWNPQTGRQINSMSCYANYVFALARDRTHDLMVSASSNGNLDWWDMKTGKLIHTIYSGKISISSDILVSLDGMTVALGNYSICELDGGDVLEHHFDILKVQDKQEYTRHKSEFSDMYARPSPQ